MFWYNIKYNHKNEKIIIHIWHLIVLMKARGTRCSHKDKRDSLYQVSALTWAVIVYAGMPNTDFQEEQRAPASRHDRKKKKKRCDSLRKHVAATTTYEKRENRSVVTHICVCTVYTKHIVYKNLFANLFMTFLLIYLIYDKRAFI